ncbi:MAG: hypothetical protein P4L33_16145 [Capsulimonadaceae bacterium]|nr:hypothetical protein [Capsulimonadaceae bacterium]
METSNVVSTGTSDIDSAIVYSLAIAVFQTVQVKAIEHISQSVEIGYSVYTGSSLDYDLTDLDMLTVRNNYEIDKASFSKVIAILEHRADITRVLAQSVEPINRIFEPTCQPVVELVCEPDSDGDSALYAVIRWCGDIDDAYARLDRFYATWWDEQAEEVRAVINIGLDVV